MHKNMAWCNISGMSEIPELRITQYGLADYPPGAILGPRTLSDYEIVWIERGDCIWEANGEAHSCPVGTVVLCQPGFVDEFTWDPLRMTRHGYLHFEFLGTNNTPLPLLRHCTADDVVRPLLRHAIWLASLGGDDNDRLSATALGQALTWFVDGHVAPNNRAIMDGRHPVLIRAFRTLERRWRDKPKVPPTISDWAADSGVSRGHLARVVKKQFDVTPQELLRYLRLDQGLMLLARSDLKIQVISELCGFASPFHFSRCCKQAYGFSPRALRQRMMAGEGTPENPVPGLRRIMQQLINMGYHSDSRL